MIVLIRHQKNVLQLNQATNHAFLLKHHTATDRRCDNFFRLPVGVLHGTSQASLNKEINVNGVLESFN